MIFFISTVGTLILNVKIKNDYFLLFRHNVDTWSWLKYKTKPDYLTKDYSWSAVPAETLLTHSFRLFREIGKAAHTKPELFKQQVLEGNSYFC